MVLDVDVLEARENNFLAALAPADGDEPWGVSATDGGGGEGVSDHGFEVAEEAGVGFEVGVPCGEDVFEGVAGGETGIGD
jgi:hypothetical protein